MIRARQPSTPDGTPGRRNPGGAHAPGAARRLEGLRPPAATRLDPCSRPAPSSLCSVSHGRNPQSCPARGRAPPAQPLPRAGRCGIGQDPGDRPQDRAAAAVGPGAEADRGHHLHQQGRAGDARAGQGQRGRARRQGPGDQHLPLAGRAHAAHGRHPHRPEGELLHPRQRRRAGRAARCRRHHGRQARAKLAVDDQPVEEPGTDGGPGPVGRAGRPRAHRRAGHGALRGAPAGLPGGGLRRPDRPAAEAAAA